MTSLGFVTPTPIQARCVPIALMGKDMCACAATGTGWCIFAVCICCSFYDLLDSKINHFWCLVLALVVEQCL